MPRKQKTPRKTNRLSLLDSAIGVGQWLWDKAATFIGAGAGAGLIGYLASITTWLDRWGPIAWGAISLLTFLALFYGIAGAKLLLAGSRVRRARASHAEMLAETRAISPLDPRYTAERIRLIDLMSPFGDPICNRTFEDCELIGPATLIFTGCSIDGGAFAVAEWVKIAGDTFSAKPNKVAFQGCRFINCRFYSVICLVPASAAGDFDMRGNMEWLN